MVDATLSTDDSAAGPLMPKGVSFEPPGPLSIFANHQTTIPLLSKAELYLDTNL